MRYFSLLLLIIPLSCRPIHPSGSFVEYYKGEYKKALKMALNEIKNDPSDPENYYLAGICYGKLEHYHKSLMSLKKALELSDKYSSPLQKRILLDLGEISFKLAEKYNNISKQDSSIFYYKKAYEYLLKYITLKN